MKTLNLIFLIIVFTSCSSSIIAENNEQDTFINAINSFEECVAAGNKVLRSYPAQCITKDGQRFYQEVNKPKKLCVDNCGNGRCEEIVCMGEGCPCAENKETCPKDCE